MIFAYPFCEFFTKLIFGGKLTSCIWNFIYTFIFLADLKNPNWVIAVSETKIPIHCNRINYVGGLGRFLVSFLCGLRILDHTIHRNLSIATITCWLKAYSCFFINLKMWSLVKWLHIIFYFYARSQKDIDLPLSVHKSNG